MSNLDKAVITAPNGRSVEIPGSIAISAVAELAVLSALHERPMTNAEIIARTPEMAHPYLLDAVTDLVAQGTVLWDGGERFWLSGEGMALWQWLSDPGSEDEETLMDQVEQRYGGAI